QTRPGVGVEEAASFQAMIAADIVVDAAVEAGTGRYDEVAFGRMQVAARRVTAQRPARAPELLPGRQPQRQLAQDRRTVDVEATRGDAAGDMEVAVGGSHSISQERQIEDRCAVVGTEGVRLCRPVEVARSRGVAVKVMLAAPVIGEHLPDTILPAGRVPLFQTLAHNALPRCALHGPLGSARDSVARWHAAPLSSLQVHVIQ